MCRYRYHYFSLCKHQTLTLNEYCEDAFIARMTLGTTGHNLHYSPHSAAMPWPAWSPCVPQELICIRSPSYTSGMPGLASCQDSHCLDSSEGSSEIMSKAERRRTGDHISDRQRVPATVSGPCPMHFTSWESLTTGNKEQAHDPVVTYKSDSTLETAAAMDQSRISQEKGPSTGAESEDEQIQLQSMSTAQASETGGVWEQEPLGPISERSQEEHRVLPSKMVIDSLTTKDHEERSWSDMSKADSEHVAVLTTKVASENGSVASASGDQSRPTPSVTTTGQGQKSWAEMVEDDLEDGTSKPTKLKPEQKRATSPLAGHMKTADPLTANSQEKKSWADIVEEEEEEVLQAAIARLEFDEEDQMEQAPFRLRSLADIREAVEMGKHVGRDREDLRALFIAITSPRVTKEGKIDSRDSADSRERRCYLHEDSKKQVRPEHKVDEERSKTPKSKREWPPRRKRDKYVNPPDGLTAETPYGQRQECKTASAIRATSVDLVQSESVNVGAPATIFPYTALMKDKYPPNEPSRGLEGLESTKSRLSSDSSDLVHDHSPIKPKRGLTTSTEEYKPPVTLGTDMLEETVPVTDITSSTQGRACSPATISHGEPVTECSTVKGNTTAAPAAGLATLSEDYSTTSDSHEVSNTEDNIKRQGRVAVPIIGLSNTKGERSTVKGRGKAPNTGSQPVPDKTVHKPVRSPHPSPSGRSRLTSGKVSKTSLKKGQSGSVKEVDKPVSNPPSKKAEIISRKEPEPDPKSKHARRRRTRKGAVTKLGTVPPDANKIDSALVDKPQDRGSGKAEEKASSITAPDATPHTPKKARPQTWAELVRGTPSGQHERAASSWSGAVSGKKTASRSDSLEPVTVLSGQPRTSTWEPSTEGDVVDISKELTIHNSAPSINTPIEDKPTSTTRPEPSYASIVRGENLLRPHTLTSPLSPPNSASSLSPSLGGYLTAPQTPLETQAANGISGGSSNEQFFPAVESFDGTSDRYPDNSRRTESPSIGRVAGGSSMPSNLTETPNKSILEGNKEVKSTGTGADTSIGQDTVHTNARREALPHSKTESSAPGSRRILEVLDLAVPRGMLTAALQKGHQNQVGEVKEGHTHHEASESDKDAAKKNTEVKEDPKKLKSRRVSTCTQDNEVKGESDAGQGKAQPTVAARPGNPKETAAQVEASDELTRESVSTPDISYASVIETAEGSVASSSRGDLEKTFEKHRDAKITTIRPRADIMSAVTSRSLEQSRLQDVGLAQLPQLDGSSSTMIASPHDKRGTRGGASSYVSSHSRNSHPSFVDTRSPPPTYSFHPSHHQPPYQLAYPTWGHPFPPTAIPGGPQPIYIPASMMAPPSASYPYHPYYPQPLMLHPQFSQQPLPYPPFIMQPPHLGAYPPHRFQPPPAPQVPPAQSQRSTAHARKRSAVDILTESAYRSFSKNTNSTAATPRAAVHNKPETTSGSVKSHQPPPSLPVPPPPPHHTPSAPPPNNQHNPRRISNAPAQPLLVEKEPTTLEPRKKSKGKKRQRGKGQPRFIRPCRRTIVEYAIEMINQKCKRCDP